MDNRNSYQLPAKQDNGQSQGPGMPSFFSDDLPTQPTSKSPNRKKTIVLLAIGSVFLLGTSTVALLGYLSRPLCLTVADYQTITGNAYQDDSFAPKDNFYTYKAAFQQHSADYEVSSKSSTLAFIKKLGNFISVHHDTSMIITLTSDYTSNHDEQIAQDRLYALKAALAKAGVPETSIILETPAYIDAESDADLMALTFMTVTSSSECR